MMKLTAILIWKSNLSQLKFRDALKEKKLEKNYDGPVYEVVAEILGALSSRRVVDSSSFKSSVNQLSVKCAQKANELLLYPLERGFLALPKPTILIQHSEISAVIFSRVGGNNSNLKTFEMKITTTTGNDTIFSNIPREEHEAIEEYCLAKKLRIQNEIVDEEIGAVYDSDSEEENAGIKRPADDLDSESGIFT